MRNYKHGILSILCLIFMLWSQIGLAAYLSFTPLIPVPKPLVAGRQVLFSYVVTNNANSPLTINDHSDFPAGANIVVGPGYCGSTTTLATNGSSCIAAYTYTPPAGSQNFQGQAREYMDETKVTQGAPEINVSVVPKPTPSMPALSLNPTTLKLKAYETKSVVVTNNSTTTTANNVKLYDLPSNIATATSCNVIQPSSTCTINITSKNTALPPTQYLVQGANTFGTNLSLTIKEPHFVPASVTINNHDVDTNLQLTNDGDGPGTVKFVNVATIPGTFENVSYVSNDCTNIPVGGTCNVKLNATKDAYGSGAVNITYFDGGAGPDLYAATTATVAETNIQFQEAPNPSDELKILPGNGSTETKTFHIQNTGNFTWRDPSADWKTTAIPNVSIANNTCSSNVDPGNSCQFGLVSTGATIGDSKAIEATGKNLDPDTTERNVLVDAPPGAIAMMLDLTHQHLYYRAIELKNTTAASHCTIDSITPTDPIPSKIVHCAAGDPVCVNACNIAAGLNAGESCLIWFKSDKNESAGLGTASPASVTVAATVHWTPSISSTVNKTFNMTYAQHLYAGGNFTTAGEVSVNNIAKWDGSTWSTVNSGPGGTVHALAIYNGDLYAGLYPSKLAKWNGSSWSTINTWPYSTHAGNGVFALTPIGNYLYIGGEFYDGPCIGPICPIPIPRLYKWDGATITNVGPITGPIGPIHALSSIGSDLYAGGVFPFQVWPNPNTYHNIAKWNGTALSNLGTGINPPDIIYALASKGTDLYAGGLFLIRGDNIAKWNGSTWSPLASGVIVNNQVSALNIMNGDLYLGGQFTTATDGAGTHTVNYITKWNESSSLWSALGTGISGSGALGVFSLTSFNNILYAGGHFTAAGGTAANSIAAWNGSTWAALGSGLAWSSGSTTYPRCLALFVAPSLDIEEP